MPKIDGIEAARQIKDSAVDAYHHAHGVDDDTHLYDAIKAGANGYLLKDLASRRCRSDPQVVSQAKA